VHEIFGPHSAQLIPPDDLGALIGAITAALSEPEDIRRLAENLRIRVRSEFSLSTMVECNLAAYREAIAARNARSSHNQILKMVHYVCAACWRRMRARAPS